MAQMGARMAADADTQWEKSLADERAWREGLYVGDDTPLSPEARRAFTGLSWFPPDPRFRVRGVALERHASPKPAGLAATGEDAVEFVEVGLMRFRVLDADVALTVFEPAPGEVDETYLFVPFRDDTSGKESYGAGRYLDFDPTATDEYEVDFNRAYHPYCVFDDAWACALPPPQNRVPVRVTAGERLPPKA